uniref:Sodium/calcium exchanger membrane region domain-containing protein n=1 Tax=Lactuca sativa TaxID=4236 RepID=A0A9R1VCI5_LACSA|nr:hypothetical protein LSAT_V11C500264200 [Lactuca sativa]
MFVVHSICVLVGWIMGRPLDLNFQLFETTTLIMTVLAVAFMLQDGTSNYFKGVILVFCYLIVAANLFSSTLFMELTFVSSFAEDKP